MKILILGNGFDLAHKLPTKYLDFLDFFSFWRSGYKGVENKNYSKFIDIRDEIQKSNRVLDDKISKLVIDNVWIKYFTTIVSTVGENWIDFEEEICEVVKLFENNVGINFNNNIKNHVINDCVIGVDYAKTAKKLIADLDDLILLLEIYLIEVVKKFEQRNIPFFNENKFDKVLSFNYTNTYRDVYDKSVEIDFIHGEADYKEKNNMVVGIKESQADMNIKYNDTFIDIKKYFQRFNKETGILYEKWLSYIENGVEKNSEVHIFGHSLNSCDGDILNSFFDEKILGKGTKIYIYYHTEETKKEYYKKLISLLSIQRVRVLTSNVDAKIKFIYLNT